MRGSHGVGGTRCSALAWAVSIAARYGVRAGKGRRRRGGEAGCSATVRGVAGVGWLRAVSGSLPGGRWLHASVRGSVARSKWRLNCQGAGCGRVQCGHARCRNAVDLRVQPFSAHWLAAGG